MIDERNEPPAVYRYGRLALWLVLVLIVFAVGYAVWQALANWTAITV